VRIGTCADPTDAAFIRSMFAARGIPVVIGAEHHAGLLGPIGGAFLSLDIWVAAELAEEAAELLRDLREGDAETAPDPTAELDPDDPAFDDDGEDEWRVRGAVATEPAAQVALERREVDVLRMRAYQRRRAVVAVLSGMFLTFGTAHLFTGAWGRGLWLAALQIFGIYQVSQGNKAGVAAIAAAIVLDLTGTMWRMIAERRTLDDAPALPTADGRPQLPEARINPPS
jgi:hypothetical protein